MRIQGGPSPVKAQRSKLRTLRCSWAASSAFVSTHHDRRAGVADAFHRSGDGVRPASAQLRNILKYASTGKEFGTDAVHFPPQAAALAFEARATRGGEAEVLARAAPRDDVDPA
jgi:hypothetical protein